MMRRFLDSTIPARLPKKKKPVPFRNRLFRALAF